MSKETLEGRDCFGEFVFLCLLCPGNPADQTTLGWSFIHGARTLVPLRKVARSLTPLYIEELKEYYAALETPIPNVEAEDSASALPPGAVDKLLKGQQELAKEMAEMKAAQSVQINMIKETYSKVEGVPDPTKEQSLVFEKKQAIA